ncbi:MAG: transcriptional repressor [bacterium]
MIKNDIFEQFKEKCSQHSLKVTPQRAIVYQELCNLNNHPSVDVIFEKVKRKLPNISFDTVYRTIQSFADMGIVNIVEGYGKQRRYDTDADNHHHMHCVKCGKIMDFHNDEYNNIAIPEDVIKKFQVLNKKVVLEGICSECTHKK